MLLYIVTGFIGLFQLLPDQMLKQQGVQNIHLISSISHQVLRITEYYTDHLLITRSQNIKFHFTLISWSCPGLYHLCMLW